MVCLLLRHLVYFFDFGQENMIYLYVVRRWGILEEMSLHISSKSLKRYQGEIAALKKIVQHLVKEFLCLKL